ncbi:MAG TPA: hypothetical protein VFI11_12805 [Anaerolineales bacterium]|nr:hypothetical protein [Anaerolineales bacterium]
MMKPTALGAGWVAAALLQACTGGASSLQSTEQALSLRQTEVAIEGTASALTAAETALAASPTASPRPPTATPMPTATPGPLILYDDFRFDDGRWDGCSHCRYEDGELVVGPYSPSEGAYGVPIVCEDCGVVADYDMAVDVRFIDGQSDRGFGLLLRYDEETGRYLDLEAMTWQVYGVWYFDPQLLSWSTLGGWKYSPSMYPSYLSNHIEVQVRGPWLQIDMNGVTVEVYENLPPGPGKVGLVVGFHGIQVAFDNFAIVIYPTEGGPPADST